jgi:uncharacterized protein YyaL (SSP411 family)
MLAAVDFYVGPAKEIAIVGKADEFISVLRRHYLPRTVVAAGPNDQIALLRDRTMVDARPTAYVCENFTCKQPVTDPSEFEAQLV